MKKNELEQAIEIAGDMAKQYRKDMRAYLKDRALGTSEATPEEAESFVKLMLKRYPPQMWVAPDGHTEYNSAWIIDLREKFVSEPKGWWREIMHVLERMGPLPMPVIEPVAVGAPPGVVPPAVVSSAPPPLGPVDNNGVSLGLGAPPAPIGGM